MAGPLCVSAARAALRPGGRQPVLFPFCVPSCDNDQWSLELPQKQHSEDLARATSARLNPKIHDGETATVPGPRTDVLSFCFCSLRAGSTALPIVDPGAGQYLAKDNFCSVLLCWLLLKCPERERERVVYLHGKHWSNRLRCNYWFNNES